MSKLTIEYEEVPVSGLAPALKGLYHQSMLAMEKAYAPYSNFSVGAGLLLENGNIITGNNQENAAYPSGLCAERVAFFKLRSEELTPVQAVMVVTRNQDGVRAESFPCGACRQVMLEYAENQEKPISIFMQKNADSFLKIKDLRSLLPFSFTNKIL